MEGKFIAQAVEAGVRMFEKDAHRLPYSDGLFLLKQFLHNLEEGKLGVFPIQRNEEGNPVIAPQKDQEPPPEPNDD